MLARSGQFCWVWPAWRHSPQHDAFFCPAPPPFLLLFDAPFLLAPSASAALFFARLPDPENAPQLCGTYASVSISSSLPPCCRWFSSLCPSSSTEPRAGARMPRLVLVSHRCFFTSVVCFAARCLWFVGGQAMWCVCVGPSWTYLLVWLSRFTAAAWTRGASGGSPIRPMTASDAAIARLPFVSCVCSQFVFPCFERRKVLGGTAAT